MYKSLVVENTRMHICCVMTHTLVISKIFTWCRDHFQATFGHTLTIYRNPVIGGSEKESLIEGSLETKVPTIWTDEKQSQEETRTCRKSEGRISEMEKVRREKMQVREKVGKSRNPVFFQCFEAPEGRKGGSLKRRVRRHLGR